MRRESRQQNAVTLSSVQGYHQGGYGLHDREAYAYIGFKSNKYFTSDRFIKLSDSMQRLDGKPLKGYGLEIETECRGLTNQTLYAEVLNNIIFKLFPDDLFKLQRDGSLRGDTSAECITQVMTKEFIRNNYSAFKTMYNTYFPGFGVSCYDSGHCGMHVNISLGCFGLTAAAQSEAVKKLYYIINRHFNFMCCLLYRKPSNTGYCGRMPLPDANYAKTLDLNGFQSDHYVCLNLGHYAAGRVELRLVGGQKDFGAFRNTMESVFFLIDRVKTLAWADVDSLPAIFKGCNRYVWDRIKTKCDDYLTPQQFDEMQRNVDLTAEYI